MRYCTLVLALTGGLLISGCAKLVSVNPIITDTEARLDPALPGVWQDNEGEDTLVIKQAGNRYAIRYMDKSSTVKLEARLMEVGDARLLDVVASDDDPFRIAAHIPMRIWQEGSTLRLSFLDSDWLRQQAAQQLPLQAGQDRAVILAPGAAVRNFLVKFGTDTRAYSEVHVLNRAR